MKTAVITGITGQDGAYLARYLLNKDYQVYGTCRRTSSVNLWRLQELCQLDHPQLHIVDYDLTDLSAAIRLLETTQPGEVYNLAAQSFVGLSFDQPVTTAQINCLGTLNVLEAIRTVNPKIRFYQASSSEMFGKVQSVPQNEETPFYPRSPYGVTKLFGHWMTINYREAYHIFGASGILFNHESPLRGREFVTRKITDGLARVKLGEQTHIELGNLDAKRDWGFAGDYVEGMHAMLQLDEPDTFVLATGRAERVRDFVEMTCKALDIDIVWEGEGKEEKGIDTKTGATIVKINPHFYRPAEVDLLIGDAEKARVKLGWRATTPLEELCAMMVESDLRRVKNGNSF